MCGPKIYLKIWTWGKYNGYWGLRMCMSKKKKGKKKTIAVFCATWIIEKQPDEPACTACEQQTE